MSGAGWVKLHRKMMSWEWYQDANTFRLFLHLLLSANHERNQWQGLSIMPGQVVTGRHKLAADLKLTERQIRTSLNRLKSTNEIAIKSTNKFSVVTICKWEQYQDNKESERPAERPAISQSSDQQTTTNKKEKKEKKKRIERVNDFTPPTLSEVKAYFTEKGYSTEAAVKAFDYYHSAGWKDSNGKPVKNWKQKMIAVWFKPESKKQEIKTNNLSEFDFGSITKQVNQHLKTRN